VDVRFIAATNRDLDSEVKAGRFRADLFYRISAVTLRLPPLRDRTHDIRLLAEHFVRTAAARSGRPVPRLREDCLSALTHYSFPGNVRELDGEMSRLVDGFRKKRNVSSYDVAGSVSDKEADEMLKLATSLGGRGKVDQSDSPGTI
jgi:transcriptional regulator with GAF, ATPase, and Fis domain